MYLVLCIHPMGVIPVRDYVHHVSCNHFILSYLVIYQLSLNNTVFKKRTVWLAVRLVPRVQHISLVVGLRLSRVVLELTLHT